MICYFCENNPATTTKLGEPSCDVCKPLTISVLNPEIHRRSDKEKALFFKRMMRTIEVAFSEDEEDETDILSSIHKAMIERGKQAKESDK